MNLQNLSYKWAGGVPEFEGVWCEIDGVQFRLRALSEKSRPLLVYMAAHNIKAVGNNPDELPPLLAEAAVMDWGADLKDADGEPIPYSRETALELLTLHPVLAGRIFQRAMLLREEEAAEEDEVKIVSAG